ncbi:ABC-F family ATP-binding cassette domain-containing protein [Serpentinicella alkaliphila]|uniref:ATP-binding cassette subfamily F protein 3 n=1 Tax=Serpentinicella alkaliphila TaxID=1734049 RepID=A0A4R2T2U9_9FIRM|nr:ABC-F family ATP-binding cassette domain-containing protein [Serpentinicella alkaliphila]QUH24880.1 ABC-F family ATP-binding cassette domain-containing protein [Serpentinicella alkaliphila]TCP96295.1 ATP-binding cassette subfamily F protein 3 [Serpentinicella alkaliphila]
MIVLSCHLLSKSYGIQDILKDITFSINHGDKVGLIGANGAGKTTLFKILTGELKPDSGNIFVSKSTEIGYLKQNHTFDISNTIYEETEKVFSALIEMEKNIKKLENEIADLGVQDPNSRLLEAKMEEYSTILETFNNLNGYGFRSEVRGVLRGLGFTEENYSQPIGHLSGGQKTRVALAKLLLSKPDILLLDEPTNHLDISSVEWLEGFLKDYSGTVLIISHDRYFLNQVINKIMEIENMGLLSFTGNYSQFMKKKEQLLEQRAREFEALESEILRQKDIIRKLKQHGTEKLVKRAQSREKQLEKLENNIQTPMSQKKAVNLSFSSVSQSGRDVLNVDNLSKSFEGNNLFDNISFSLYRGEKVGLIGPNGIGKSTLFKILTNEVNSTSGSISFGHQVTTSLYDQELNNLNPENTVLDEIWDEYRKLDQTEIRTLLGAFLFPGDDVFKQIKSLSGGEKARLSLLKLILSNSNLLLLDEPTNHLDISSKEVLENALIDYDGTIFVISHDRYFLDRVTTKIIELTPNNCEEFLGNYSYYIEKKREQELLNNSTLSTESKTKTQIKEDRKKEKEEKAKIRQLQKRKEDIEDEISRLETGLEELKSIMCEEEVYSNPDRSKEAHEKFQQLQEKIDNLYEEWQELE